MRDRALGSTVRMQFVSTNPDAGGAPVAPSSAFAAADIYDASVLHSYQIPTNTKYQIPNTK